MGHTAFNKLIENDNFIYSIGKRVIESAHVDPQISDQDLEYLTTTRHYPEAALEPIQQTHPTPSQTADQKTPQAQ